jgi:hypothetical protein
MFRTIARLTLVLGALATMAACTSATAPANHDCNGGGMTGGTGTC